MLASPALFPFQARSGICKCKQLHKKLLLGGKDLRKSINYQGDFHIKTCKEEKKNAFTKVFGSSFRSEGGPLADTT